MLLFLFCLSYGSIVEDDEIDRYDEESDEMNESFIMQEDDDDEDSENENSRKEYEYDSEIDKMNTEAKCQQVISFTFQHRLKYTT